MASDPAYDDVLMNPFLIHACINWNFTHTLDPTNSYQINYTFSYAIKEGCNNRIITDLQSQLIAAQFNIQRTNVENQDPWAPLSWTPTYSEFCDYLNNLIQERYAITLGIDPNIYLQKAAAIKNRYPSQARCFGWADSLEQIIDNNGYLIGPDAMLFNVGLDGGLKSYYDTRNPPLGNLILTFSTQQDDSLLPNIPWHAVINSDAAQCHINALGDLQFEDGSNILGTIRREDFVSFLLPPMH